MPAIDPDAPASPFAPLLTALSGVTRPGDFCTSGTVVTPIPRVDVDGVGTIAFPLQPFQARQLIEAAEAAPYGRGPETLVDADVRRAWQFPPARVRLQDPQWDATLASIVAQAAAGLGVAGDVTAELYKMLVYDAGGFFVPHRDTEKAPHMFGTLVIVLPSTYDGGELVVRHGGRETVLPLAGEDVSRVSFGGFYADCVHELRPITAGFRLCLVYNLLLARGAPPVAPDNSREVAEAAAFLRTWGAGEPPDDAENDGGMPEKLVFVLDHHYTPAELSFSALKNRDAAVAGVLLAAAAMGDAAIHLAMVSIEESGSCEPTEFGGGYGKYDRYDRYDRYDDEGDEEEGEEFEVYEIMQREETVDGWVAPGTGPVALGRLPIWEDELYPPESLEDEKPDEQHLHEATGNGGASFERTYRRAALVVWPRRKEIGILAHAPLDAIVATLSPLVASTDPDDRERALELATAIAEGSSRSGASGRVAVLRLLRELGEADLVVRFVHRRFRQDFVAADIEDLLACRALGRDTLTRVVATVVEAQVGKLDLCLDLLDLVAAVDLDVARKGASVLLDSLPGASSAIYQRPNADGLARLYGVLLHFQEPDLLARIVAYTTARFANDRIDEVILPALLAVWAHPEAPAAFDTLRAACIAYLRQRVAEPCEPPRDWARAAPIRCGCADCQTATAFLADPRAQRWELKAAQDRRSHVESRLAGLDVALSTDRKGSPHRLVAVKNQRSYDRRAAQRHADLAALRVLGG